MPWQPKEKKSVRNQGVVGWCEGVMYLASPGHPTDACSWTRPAILVAGKGRGGGGGGGGAGVVVVVCVFIYSVSSLSFLFLFLPCSSLSTPLLSLLFSPFL